MSSLTVRSFHLNRPVSELSVSALLFGSFKSSLFQRIEEEGSNGEEEKDDKEA